MTGIPTLRTERLVLRQATWDDLEAVHRFMSDPRAMRYWSRPEHETLEETRHWLGSLVDQAEDSRDWLVAKDGMVIGKPGRGRCRRWGSSCIPITGDRGWPSRRWRR